MPLTLLGFTLQRFPLSESRTPLGAVAPLRLVRVPVPAACPAFRPGRLHAVVSRPAPLESRAPRRQARFCASSSASSAYSRKPLLPDRGQESIQARLDPSGLRERIRRAHSPPLRSFTPSENPFASDEEVPAERPILSWVCCPLELSPSPRWARLLGGCAPRGQPPLLGDRRPPLTSFSYVETSRPRRRRDLRVFSNGEIGFLPSRDRRLFWAFSPRRLLTPL